ncbi:mast cell protease 1-like [Mixophyes fleayi]|uniref:mast cell protease 1-like n=1 Tax=Mixophyes fleayi TaxID=3061075 RepID=UPI003F4E373C
MEQLPVILVFVFSSLLSIVPCAGHYVRFSEKLRHGIIGGKEARPHSRPYMAYLKIGGSICGGSLIAPDWVLSAAHCEGKITVILGAHDVDQTEHTQQILGVQSYYVHPNYTDVDSMPINDVMLLRLSPRAQINHYVQTIPLTNSGSDLPQNTLCNVAGWGLIDKTHSTNKLFETNVTIVNRRSCRRIYYQLTDGMICAGSTDKITDSSQGDSGGPLVCGGTVEGIVSFGYDHPPGVYAKVGKYLDWIRDTISQHKDTDVNPAI